jgi:hypothetical protein
MPHRRSAAAFLALAYDQWERAMQDIGLLPE